MELSLYKVSDEPTDQPDANRLNTENQSQNSYTPKTKEYLLITISQMFIEVLLFFVLCHFCNLK